MIKYPGKSIPLALVFPIPGGLRCEQMEKTVVCCRNRTAKIHLFRVVRQIELGQENRMLNQVVVIGQSISRKPFP